MEDLEDHMLQPGYLLGRIEALQTLVAAMAAQLPAVAMRAVDEQAKALHDWCDEQSWRADSDPKKDRASGVHDGIVAVRNMFAALVPEMEEGHRFPSLQPYPIPDDARRINEE